MFSRRLNVIFNPEKFLKFFGLNISDFGTNAIVKQLYFPNLKFNHYESSKRI
jgi:hypothetical protein